jgi:hypothetical protein
MPYLPCSWNARGYKSVESLIDAFTAVAADDAVLLLMMRQSFDPGYAEEIRIRAADDERIRVFTPTTSQSHIFSTT